MAKVRIVLNRKAVAGLLRSPRTAALLRRHAEKIAAAAGEGMEVDVETGRRRARASVRTATRDAVKAEATDRALTKALDAGR